MTSYIPTDAAQRTRARDVLTVPFTGRPQPMTVYARIINGVTANMVASAQVVFQVGSTTFGARRFYVGLVKTGGSLAAQVAYVDPNNVSTTATATATANPEDGLEVRGLIFSDGSIQAATSVNGGAETVGSVSATSQMPSSWTSAKAQIGGAGSAGLMVRMGVREIVVARGNQSLATMRRLAGVQSA